MLSDKSKYIDSDDRSISSLEITPLNLLSDKSRTDSSFNFQMVDGIGPSRLFGF